MTNSTATKSLTALLTTLTVVAALLLIGIAALFFTSKDAVAAEIPATPTPAATPEDTIPADVKAAADQFAETREQYTTIPAWLCVTTDGTITLPTDTPDMEMFASVPTSQTDVAGGGTSISYSTPACSLPILTNDTPESNTNLNDTINAKNAEMGLMASSTIDKMYTLHPATAPDTLTYPGLAIVAAGITHKNNPAPNMEGSLALYNHGEADLDTLYTLPISDLNALNTALAAVN